MFKWLRKKRVFTVQKVQSSQFQSQKLNRFFQIQPQLHPPTSVFCNGLIMRNGIDGDYIIHADYVVFNVPPHVGDEILVEKLIVSESQEEHRIDLATYVNKY